MEQGGKAAATVRTGLGKEEDEEGRVATDEFAPLSLSFSRARALSVSFSHRRDRSITDLQYSRRSLLHGGSFAAASMRVCARARECFSVYVYVFVGVCLPSPWKEEARQRGMETFCRGKR